MSITDSLNFNSHEKLAFYHYAKRRLNFYIAIHNTALGPSLGGCRYLNYKTEQNAIDDVLNLSSAMTYKHALAKTPFGGAKAVVIGDPKQKTDDIYRFLADAVNQQNGQFIISQDSGFSEQDLYQMAKYTQYIAFPTTNQKLGANPSPATAKGMFYGIQTAVQYKFNTTDLKGIKVAIQGVGSVGADLARQLHSVGAEVCICDHQTPNVERLHNDLGLKIVHYDDIYSQDVDIFCPCALGGAINSTTIKQLKASIVAGCANNQLDSTNSGDLLFERGILYAPDFVINSGGIMNCHMLVIDGNAEMLNRQLHNIKDRLLQIWTLSQQKSQPANIIAIELANKIIDKKC